MTQQQQVLKYLEERGKITSYRAAVDLDIINLPQKIRERRAKGYKIGDTTVKKLNRYNEPVTFKEYYIKKEN